MTSPPLVSWLGAVFTTLKGGRFRLLGDGPEPRRGARGGMAAPRVADDEGALRDAEFQPAPRDDGRGARPVHGLAHCRQGCRIGQDCRRAAVVPRRRWCDTTARAARAFVGSTASTASTSSCIRGITAPATRSRRSSRRHGGCAIAATWCSASSGGGSESSPCGNLRTGLDNIVSCRINRSAAVRVAVLGRPARGRDGRSVCRHRSPVQGLQHPRSWHSIPVHRTAREPRDRIDPGVTERTRDVNAVVDIFRRRLLTPQFLSERGSDSRCTAATIARANGVRAEDAAGARSTPESHGLNLLDSSEAR